jgi:hypothetical protein
LCGFYYNGPRSARCSAADDRASHTAYSGSHWTTYDGPGYGASRCTGQSAIVIGETYCRTGQKDRSRKGND